jgi:hypothetical protein
MDQDSYWMGVEVGLRAAEVVLQRGGNLADVVKQRRDVETHQKRRRGPPASGADAEWHSWMVELELRSWAQPLPPPPGEGSDG